MNTQQLRRRLHGCVKKSSELSILCGVQVHLLVRDGNGVMTVYTTVSEGQLPSRIEEIVSLLLFTSHGLTGS